MADLIFNKYAIQSRLAVGGMGEVLYALQKGLPGFDRPAILKSLLPELAEQEGFIEQFLDEARVAAKLNHPNVVSIFEVGRWCGVYFIAMEYIQGRNLAQLISASVGQGKPMPLVVMARILHDAALGLHHAHTALDVGGRPMEIVHRDISPQNIMVRDDGVTKVLDFGIAHATHRASRVATPAVGRLGYMAPEQLMHGKLTGRTDQFGLGVVLWEMVCGRRLFQAPTELELMKKVLESKVPSPSQLVPGLPAEFDAIAMKMLERDPARRYDSCEEVALALDHYLVAQSAGGGREARVAAYLKVLGPSAPAMAPGELPMEHFVPRPSQPRAAPRAVEPARPRTMGLKVLGGLLAMLAGAAAFMAWAQAGRAAPAPVKAAVVVSAPDAGN